MNNASAFGFKEARLSSTGGLDIEHNKNCRQFSTIMRDLTSKDVDFLSLFDKIDESQAEIGLTSLKHLLINNNDVAANKGKNKAQLPLEHIIRLCRTFEKTTKQLGFHLTFKTADLQDIIYTTLDDDIQVKIDNFFSTSQCSFLMLKRR